MAITGLEKQTGRQSVFRFSARACDERPGNADAHARAIHAHARASEVPDPGFDRRADVDDVHRGRANVRAPSVNGDAGGRDYR